MSSAESPAPALLQAAPAWQAIDLVSDLHLHVADQATLQAFARYLEATPADVICILGDLFDVWVGDDAIEPGSFESVCAGLLHAAARRKIIHIMHGNRDFLLGPQAMQAFGTKLLQDPTRLEFAGQAWLLSHGDALCLADTDYMAFRATVRSAAWQADFLAQPLTQRRAQGQQMRAQSEARKRTGQGIGMADVDAPAARAWLRAADCSTLIHGHTHQPADHALGEGMQRLVLSDWDCSAIPLRAQVLRLTMQGLQRVALA